MYIAHALFYFFLNQAQVHMASPVASHSCAVKQYAAMKKIFYFIFIFLLPNSASFAKTQDSLIHILVQRIASLQVSKDDFFLDGIFPSYISNEEYFSTRKKDNNIFYNGLITLTLKGIYNRLSKEDKIICDSIFARQKNLFAYFKNKSGRNTYNFWRTDSSFKFPYTGWVKLIKKHPSLPDDMDDTVLSLLALNADDSVAENTHLFMQDYVNNENNKVRTLLKQNQNIPAYSTWFGKKFPTVFDACVISNILYFVQYYNLKWSGADSASLQYLVNVINDSSHIKNGIEVAPYYKETSIILYHYARLMSIKPIAALENLKLQLLIDAIHQFSKSDELLEKVILSNTILKLGYQPPALSLNVNLVNKIEQDNMCFFIGNVPSYMKDAQKVLLLSNKLGLFYHYCPAYNDALLLEYLVSAE